MQRIISSLEMLRRLGGEVGSLSHSGDPDAGWNLVGAATVPVPAQVDRPGFFEISPSRCRIRAVPNDYKVAGQAMKPEIEEMSGIQHNRE